MASFGLRAKSLLLLGLVSLFVLLVAAGTGWQVISGVQTYFGEAYARNTTALSRERLLAPIGRNLALARRFADLYATREWLEDESDPTRTTRFFDEAARFVGAPTDRHTALHSGSGGLYFIASARSLNYYFNDTNTPVVKIPRYTLHTDTPANDWFFRTMADRGDYNINVNTDPVVRGIKIWFNIVVMDGATPGGGRRLGVAGLGIDLSDFLNNYLSSLGPGVTPMAITRNGAIQIHPDWSRVAVGSGADGTETGRLENGAVDAARTNLLQSLSPGDADALRAALVRTAATESLIDLLTVTLDGTPRLLAVSYVPELQWYVINAFDTASIRPARMQTLMTGGVVVALLLLAAVLGVALLVSRMVLTPLRQLQQGAQAVAQGNYEVSLPTDRRDEFGDLSHSFRAMARQVQRNTEDLESRVRDRTRALEDANRAMVIAQKKMADSLEYASLIQRGLLAPDPMVFHPQDGTPSALSLDIDCLWQPKEVVGGDFHLCRRLGDTIVLGVFDCAGHGVSGALMTMRTHAAIGQALSETAAGAAPDPAWILNRADALLRTSWQGDAPAPAGLGTPAAHPASTTNLATNVDAGLVVIHPDTRQVVFSGARIDLLIRPPGPVTNGSAIACIPGNRRALADRKSATFTNTVLTAAPGQSLYLASDGILDQAGGPNGFSFGRTHLMSLIARIGTGSAPEQIDAVDAALRDYRGPLPQRDDMTLLCFRLL